MTKTHDRIGKFSSDALAGKRSAGVLLIAALMTSPPLSADTVDARFPRQARSADNTYLRLFPDLPPFAEQTTQMRAAAAQLGARGGIMDAADNLTDPLQSIINQPEFSPNNADNPDMTAGVTFLGQFLDHDITFDRRSALRRNADPNATVNFRTAAFDLDHAYGGGPDSRPDLYDVTAETIKFKIDTIPGSDAVSRGNVLRNDLPRDPLNNAIIGDSRNDENSIISQLHLAMLKFHNAVTDRLRNQEGNESLTPMQVFVQSQEVVRWHYQWIILNEFLPATIGQDRVNTLLRDGLQWYDPSAEPVADRQRESRRDSQRDDQRDGSRSISTDNGRTDRTHANSTRQTRGPRIPIEFAAAAYRFGHSQVRPSYRLNFGADADSQVFLFVFDNDIDPNAADPDDLRGGKRAPRRFIDWQTFFDLGDGNVRNNKLIDTKISSILFALPGSNVPAPGLPNDGEISLASRNLIRHVNFGLPSGQAIANAIGAPALTPEELSELAPFGMSESSPLWYYVLKEAEVMEAGLRLGPVGAAIVGEVFVGLLQADESAYLNVSPDWTPVLPSTEGLGKFTMADLLRFAGAVVPLE